MKILFTTFLFTLTSLFCFSQNTEFSALQTDLNIKNAYEQFLSDGYVSSRSQPKSEYKSDLKSYYKTRYASSLQRLENDHFIMHPSVSVYVDQLLDIIAQSNSTFNFDEVRVLLAKYVWPNAFSVGDGTLVLNIGLAMRLENEAQLAFVLSHEAAHYFLNHSDEDFIRRFYDKNSDAFKSKLEEINKSEYYQVTKLKELLKSNIYSERSHSRVHEFSADSLGLVFYLNAGYDISGAISTLELLDRLNEPIPDKVNIFTRLNIDTIAYPKASLNLVDLEREDVLEMDSVKTHPDCYKRIVAIVAMGSTGNAEINYKTEAFIDFKDAVNSEVVHCHLFFDAVGDALIHSLNQEEEEKMAAENASAIVISAHRMVHARKKHRISTVISPPSREDTSAVNDLARIAHGLRFSIFSKALYALAKEKYAWAIKDKNTMYEMLAFSYLMKDKELFPIVKASYLEKFPNKKENKAIMDMSL